MKQITTTFLRGLFTLLPLLLSVYVFIWFIGWVEYSARGVLLNVLPDFLYIPGMGVAIVFVAIYAFGVVVDKPLAKAAFNLIESLLREVPVVKTVYVAIKDFTEYLKPGKDKRAHNRVVLVKFPDKNVEMIGLMTRDTLKDMPAPVTKGERVAVYFPMSYQFGGMTLFIPREWVTPTEMSVEEAMRSIITAWLPGEDKKLAGQ